MIGTISLPHELNTNTTFIIYQPQHTTSTIVFFFLIFEVIFYFPDSLLLALFRDVYEVSQTESNISLIHFLIEQTQILIK